MNKALAGAAFVVALATFYAGGHFSNGLLHLAGGFLALSGAFLLCDPGEP